MCSKVVPTLPTDTADVVGDETNTLEEQSVPPRSSTEQNSSTRSASQSPLLSFRMDEAPRPSYETHEIDTWKAARSEPGLGRGKMQGVVSSGSLTPVTRGIAHTLKGGNLDDSVRRRGSGSDNLDLAKGVGWEQTCSGNGYCGSGRRGSTSASPPSCFYPEDGSNSRSPAGKESGADAIQNRTRECIVCADVGLRRPGRVPPIGTLPVLEPGMARAKPETVEKGEDDSVRAVTGNVGGRTSDVATCGEGGRGGRGGGEKKNNEGREDVDGDEATEITPRMSLKDFVELPGSLRPPCASFAEENNLDVSVEINSLSKISVEHVAKEELHLMLHHESPQKLAWDIFMVVLIIFSAFINPFQIAFDFQPKGTLWVLEVLVDFIFIADICLNFRTTMMDSDTRETITDFKKISTSYLKGWFVLDVITSIPVALISHYASYHALERYFFMLKLLRTLKLHQLSIITNAVLERFEDLDFNPAMFRIYVLMLAFLLVLHFIACGYWYIARTNDPEFEGIWSPEHDYLDAAVYLKYSRALYFSLVITYGNDLKPETHAETVFSNLCLVVALLANAAIIGSATSLMSNMDAGAMAKKTQMDEINGFMRSQKVPKAIQRRVRTFYQYLWDSGQDSHSSKLFDEMPDKLRLQLNMALKRRIIDQVPLFKTVTPAGIIALVQNLVPCIVLPGDTIVQQGEPATSMFFISKGTVRVFVASGSQDSGDAPPPENYVISLGAGSFFGEVALLEEAHKRTSSVVAETFSELHSIHSADFNALANIFPEFKTVVKMISKSRVKSGEAVGKMKARARKWSGRSMSSIKRNPRSSSLKAMRATVNEARAKSKGRAGSVSRMPGMRLVVERVVAAHSRYRDSGDRAMLSAAGKFASTRSFSTLKLGGGHDENLRTVYDTIVAHEERLSHEAAISMAKGTGIRQKNLSYFSS